MKAVSIREILRRLDAIEARLNPPVVDDGTVTARLRAHLAVIRERRMAQPGWKASYRRAALAAYGPSPRLSTNAASAPRAASASGRPGLWLNRWRECEGEGRVE